MQSRMGFAMRLAEVDLFPDARDHFDPGWTLVLGLTLRTAKEPYAQEDGGYPAVLAARFARTSPHRGPPGFRLKLRVGFTPGPVA